MYTNIPLFSVLCNNFWRLLEVLHILSVSGLLSISHKCIIGSLPLFFFHSKKLEMMIPCLSMPVWYLCLCRLCVIVERSASQRNLWKAICLLAFVWSNPDRHRRKGSVFRAFVCPHISGRDSCVYSMALGHFSRSWDGISHQWCHGNKWFRWYWLWQWD